MIVILSRFCKSCNIISTAFVVWPPVGMDPDTYLNLKFLIFFSIKNKRDIKSIMQSCIFFVLALNLLLFIKSKPQIYLIFSQIIDIKFEYGYEFRLGHFHLFCCRDQITHKKNYTKFHSCFS